MPIPTLIIKDPHNPSLPLQSDLWSGSVNVESDPPAPDGLTHTHRLITEIYHPAGDYATRVKKVLASYNHQIQNFIVHPSGDPAYPTKLFWEEGPVTKSMKINQAGATTAAVVEP